MTTMTPEKLEQELLEIHFLEDGLKCGDWSRIGCKNEATHFLVCPCKVGRAPMCDRCLAKAREKARPRFFGIWAPGVWFADTCKHMVKMEECSIQPI